MQLMYQQRQIQQMANQAAIAMSYFMQQQQNKMGSSNQNLHANMNIYQQKVGSLSSITNSQMDDNLDDAFIDTAKDLPPSMAEHNDDMLGGNDDDNFALFKVDRQQSLALIPSGMSTKRESLPQQMPELPCRQSSDIYGE